MPAPHPSGAAKWCKRCDVGFYGGVCPKKHQHFAFTSILPLGAVAPDWARAIHGYGLDGDCPPGCMPFAAGALITIVPWGRGGATKHAAGDNQGWLFGSTEEGAEGLVPANYLSLDGDASPTAVGAGEPAPTHAPEPEPEPGEEFLPGAYTETYDSVTAQREQQAREEEDDAEEVARVEMMRQKMHEAKREDSSIRARIEESKKQPPQPSQQPPPMMPQQQQPDAPTVGRTWPPSARQSPPPSEAPPPPVGVPAPASRASASRGVAHEPRRGSLSEEAYAEIERRVEDEVARQVYRVDEEAQAEAVRLLDQKETHDKEAEWLREIGKRLLAEERQRGGQPLPAEAAAARAAEISAEYEASAKDALEQRRGAMENEIRAETERRFAEELLGLQGREHDSASLIQATFRGGQLRKRSGGNFGKMRKKHTAATKIQAARRGTLGRRRAIMRRKGRGAWEASLDGTLLRRLEQRQYGSKGKLKRFRPQGSRHYLSRRTAVYDTLLQSVVELDRQRPLNQPPHKFLAQHLLLTAEAASEEAGSGDLDLSALKKELSGMTLLALQKRTSSAVPPAAAADGAPEGAGSGAAGSEDGSVDAPVAIEESQIEEAMESDDPNAALVTLLIDQAVKVGGVAAPLAEDLRERLHVAFAACCEAAAEGADPEGKEAGADVVADVVAMSQLERLLYTVSYRPTSAELEAAAASLDPDGTGSFSLEAFLSLIDPRKIDPHQNRPTLAAYSATQYGWARRVRMAFGSRHKGLHAEPMSYYTSCGVRDALVGALSHVDAVRPDSTEDAVQLLAKSLRAAERPYTAAAVSLPAPEVVADIAAGCDTWVYFDEQI